MSSRTLVIMAVLMGLLLPAVHGQFPVPMGGARVTFVPGAGGALDSWSVAAQSVGLGLSVDVTPFDTGDVELDFGANLVNSTTGVLIANINEDDPDSVVEVPCCSVATGNYWLAMTSATGPAIEVDRDTSFAWFPFDKGWIGGSVLADGTISDSGNLPIGSTITTLGTGRYVVTLGGIDSQTDGMLFVAGASDDDNRVSAGPHPGGGWHVAHRDNDHNYGGFEGGPWRFVYVPYDACNLIGGRIGATGTIVSAAGSFSVTTGGTGIYHISVPGVTSPTQGCLVLTSSNLPVGGFAEDNYHTYTFDDVADVFVVKSYDMPGIGLLQLAEFSFAYVDFDAPFGMPGTAACTPVPMGVARIALDAPFHIDSISPTWTVTGQTPGLGMSGFASMNRGDADLNLGGAVMSHETGVLIANVNQDESDSLIATPSISGYTGNYWLATSRNSGAEANFDMSLAYFPFSEGWIGGSVSPTGALLASGNLPVGTVLNQTAPGRYNLSVPGIDSSSDGLLFVVHGDNDDDRAAAQPQNDGSWSIATRDNEDDLGGGVSGIFRFVYVPYDVCDLVGGWIAGDGTVLGSKGGFSVVNSSTGRYEITVPGVTSASDGVLVLTPGGVGSGDATDNYLTCTYDGGLGAFVVKNYDMPAGVLQDDAFVFAYIATANPLEMPLALGFALTMGGVVNPDLTYTFSLDNWGGTPGASYFTCLTFNLGSFPNGFWFGIDPGITEIVSQFASGAPPFVGTFDSCGASHFSATLPFGPFGIPIYAVTVEFPLFGVDDATSPVMAIL